MSNIVEELANKFKIVSIINLDEFEYSYSFASWIKTKLEKIHKESFENNERIIILLNQDYYASDSQLGIKLKTLQKAANEVDISNFFFIVVTSNKQISNEFELLASHSTDPVQMHYLLDNDDSFVANKIEVTNQNTKKSTYKYGSSDLLKKDMNELSLREKFLLTESKTFCIKPWIHLHAYPTGEVYPCCGAERIEPLGNSRNSTLKEVWNSDSLKKLRIDMLSENWNPYCTRCYEQENSGFFSMRNSANKHHGHQINKISNTQPDGHLDNFELTYWDIRFSNLCNLRCRSCGYMFSSQWYNDQVKLVGKAAADFKRKTKVLNYAGRTETDMWEQLEPHLDYVEQIYFAGGEPLLMDDHYKILNELVKRKLFHVKLTYNTNFTHIEFNEHSVFEYWKLFNSVSIGASLDGSGRYAEYIRKGTVWEQIEKNRKEMLNICPEVDFYISPTLSIMNALHLPEFHRSWVEQGFIKPQDLNVNILQDPAHYRIDIATKEYKLKLEDVYNKHIEWLSSVHDPLGRATQGFKSAISFMNAIDNSHLLETFWQKTNELDVIRNENILDVIPELAALK